VAWRALLQAHPLQVRQALQRLVQSLAFAQLQSMQHTMSLRQESSLQPEPFS